MPSQSEIGQLGPRKQKFIFPRKKDIKKPGLGRVPVLNRLLRNKEKHDEK
jgi:hypothetical protein